MKLIGVVLVIVGVLAGCAGAKTGGDGTATTPRPTEYPVLTVPPNFGKIVFGLDYDPDSLAIVKATERFKATYPEIAWSASLSQSAGASKIRIVVARVSSGGAETGIIDQDVPVSNPDADTFANKIDLASLVGNKPGTYVMRYLRDADILAEGTFTLVK